MVLENAINLPWTHASLFCSSLLSFSPCWQTLEDLDKFADLVKEVTISACRNYLAEHMQSSNTGACTVTGQTCSIGCSGAEYGLLLTMMACSYLSQMIRKKATSSSRSRRPFTPAASSGGLTHTFKCCKWEQACNLPGITHSTLTQCNWCGWIQNCPWHCMLERRRRSNKK